MLPGEIDDLCNHFHRKYSGLRLRKLRLSRRRSNGVCALAVNGHQSPDFPNPADKKDVSVSKRPTLTTFPTSSSSHSSSSSSSPGHPDQHLESGEITFTIEGFEISEKHYKLNFRNLILQIRRPGNQSVMTRRSHRDRLPQITDSSL